MKHLVLLVLFFPAIAFARVDDESSPGRLTFDIGLSTGQAAGQSYTEANLGLNYYFDDWIAWRNAVFGRFQTGYDNIYGLDSSARFIANIGDHRTGLTAFVGPGYRFASGNNSAPFAEEGLVFHLAGLSVGGGAKQIFNSWIHSGSGNDNQYFLILAGGGSL